MPELPEVETVRRGLEPAMAGKHIVRAVQKRPDLRFPLPERFAERLTGRQVMHLGRRAKYLLIHLDGAEVLLAHLGMSGRYTIWPPEGASISPGDFALEGTPAGPDGSGAHDHIILDMEDGTRIVYSDHRRFGYMDLIAEEELPASKHLAGLGPEPLGNDFNAEMLAQKLRGKKTPLKAALLDQRVVAGLGNIYVCEALYRAGLSPRRLAGSITRQDGKPTERMERLVGAVRGVIAEAIEAGGSTLRDYAHTDGTLGYFQHRFSVYDREGEPCSREGCGGRVQRVVQSGRSSFFCGACQR